MNVQHQVLQTLQALLERACFEFARGELTKILEQKQWDCPEAVELNIWVSVLKLNDPIFAQADVEQWGGDLNELYSSMAALRHTSVHRLRITASRTKRFLADAVSFTNLLKDEDCCVAVRRLRQDYEDMFDELGRNKDLLELRLAEERQEIARQRAFLAQRESDAIENMFKDDRELSVSIGARLLQVIASLHDPPSDGAVTGDTSETDDDSQIVAIDDQAKSEV